MSWMGKSPHSWMRLFLITNRSGSSRNWLRHNQRQSYIPRRRRFMLTRPGSEPGPAWMRGLARDPQRLRKATLRIIIFFGIIQVGAVIAGDIAVYLVYRAHGRHISSYSSPIQVAGMPLLSIGASAHGVIAYGGIATRIVAI